MNALAHFDAHGAPPPGVRDERREAYEVQLERRAALTFTPLAFCLLAVPLGLGLRRGARSLGALFCAVIAFGYYIVGNVASTYATDGTISPTLALWLPNVACGLLALPLWWRARRAEGA